MTGNIPAPSAKPGATGLSRLLRACKPEWVFLALALPFGAAFVVLTPPYQVPDEENHFRRAFEISLGHVIAVKQGDYTGDYLPQGIEGPWKLFERLKSHREEKVTLEEIRAASDLQFDTGDRAFIAFSNTSIHPPLTYLPQALAFFLTRQFSNSALVCLYAGRLLNFLTATLLFFLAIRTTPVVKWGFSALALTPMALFESASLSSDALTNALSFLLIAEILNCALGTLDQLSRRSFIKLAALGFAVGLTKQAYFLLPLAYFLIPLRKLGSYRRYLAGFALLMGATLLPVLIWSFVIRSVYSKPDLHYNINPREQIERLFTQGDETARLISGTYDRKWIYGEQYLGFLGWLDTQLPTPIYFVELTFLIVVCLVDINPSKVSGRVALIAALVAVIVAFSVLFVIHVTWDAIGAPFIAVQGRHFIPVGPLIAIGLSYMGGRLAPLFQLAGTSLPVTIRSAMAIAYQLVLASVPVATVSVVSCTALYALYERFYVDNDTARAERTYQRGLALLDKPGQETDAYRLMEDALGIDPGHPGAHYFLGLRDRQLNPRRSIEHLRAADARSPGHFSTLNHLGGMLITQGQFAEARHYLEAALKLHPDDTRLKQTITQVTELQKQFEGMLRNISLVVTDLARTTLIEESYRGTEKEWQHLQPNRQPVVEPGGAHRLPMAFVWRWPPPKIAEERGHTSADKAEYPFYACSAVLYGPKRFFVFPPPVNAVFLSDDEISWYFQVPLAGLNSEELQKETEYRNQLGLKFPLSKLPN